MDAQWFDMEDMFALLSDMDSNGDSDSSGEKEKPQYFWAIGLIIYLSGTIMMSFGVNIQKYALNKNKAEMFEEGAEEIKGFKLCTNPLWTLGVTCYVSAGLFLSAALFFASPALLTPFMSMVLISNIIFAHFLLKEVITRKDMICIGIVVCGLVLTTFFAPPDNHYYTPDDLLKLFIEPAFIAFACVVIFVLCVLLVANYVLYYQVKACKIPAQELPGWKLQLYPFTFAALAGIFGGGTVLLMKSSIEIIVSEASKGIVHLLSSWTVYVLVFVMGLFWSMQMFWLNRGLRFFHAVYIVSLEAVINEIIAVVGSLVYFNTAGDEAFTNIAKVFFSLGLFVGVGGVLMLAYWRKEMDKSGEPNLFEQDPSTWLVEDGELEAASERGTAESKGGSTGGDRGSSVTTGPLVVTSYSGDRRKSRAVETEEVREHLMGASQPFTPSPMLAVWGLPKTPKHRNRQSHHDDSSNENAALLDNDSLDWRRTGPV